MTMYKWSQTANANATADSTINWAEGQAPSSVNDSARATMAGVAKYRDDIAGAIVTAGTSTAYTISSFQVFDTLAHLNGQMIAFSPHTTNGATATTLSVDGLGAKPLRSSPGVELQAGIIIQGTPYLALYNNSDGAFYLHGFYGAVGIPFLCGMDYWDTISPGSAFIFPAGQAINRVTYSAAFARWGTSFGSGDGSTTFNVPNKAGRVSAMMEASASLLTGSNFGGNSTVIGAIGGSESATAPLPNHNHGATVTDPGHDHTFPFLNANGAATGTPVNTVAGGVSGHTTTDAATTGISVSISSTGSGGTHNNVQPTIICNYIIRII